MKKYLDLLAHYNIYYYVYVLHFSQADIVYLNNLETLSQSMASLKAIKCHLISWGLSPPQLDQAPNKSGYAHGLFVWFRSESVTGVLRQATVF